MNKTIKIMAGFFVALSCATGYAQIPTANDLRETDALQRRDLSITGSRIVINPFDFHTKPDLVTASSYSNSPALPLNIGYLTIDREESKARFGRVFSRLLEVRKVTTNGNAEEAASYSTEWLPYALPFQAQYSDRSTLSGYDFFYDENTIIRVLNVDKKGKYILSGEINGKAKVDKAKQVLTIQTATCKYAVSLKETNLNNIVLENNRWSVAISGKQKIQIAVSFALLPEADNVLISNVKAALSKNNIDKAYTASIACWNDFLQNKIPHPQNFNINHVDNKGVTPEQIRLMYYKAWVFLAQNVIPPESDRFPYYQMATGKPSLWDEGHPIAPFSATWESFVGLQLYAYINPAISWSCLKGLMSLVEENGMLGGESLPSRKAHSAWLLYKLTQDTESLREVYPAIERYLHWRMENPRWIYGNHNFKDEKDIEFAVSVIIDMDYMRQIAEALGMDAAAKEWTKKRTDYIAQSKKWFWKTPQDLPASHPNEKPGFGNQMMIMTASYIPEITGDYFDGLLGIFYKSYDTDKSLAGFADPKYPDVDFTIYGLIQHKKNILAQGMIECYLRDVVRSQAVFAESYNALDMPYPNGVRPSLFGVAAMIDFTLLKNGYMYSKVAPCPVDLYPEEETGVDTISYF
jgi:hypothetical protein